MKSRNILISGASIAGPALAYWLSRFGFNPTVVERAAAIRMGGQAVDFRGPVHMFVLERMGLVEKLRALDPHMGAVSFVDERGRPLAVMSSEVASGDIEIQRGDLSRVLYEATQNGADYRFGDSITAMIERGDGVEVAFKRGETRTFDLVIGADGLHSNVRALAFGDESRFIHHCGYYVAIFTVPNHLNLDHVGQIYCAPGKAAGLYGARQADAARAVFYFASPPLDYGRNDIDQQKAMLADAFKDVGWATPRLIEAMWSAPDFYFDSISQIRMDKWTSGRVALLGDAGYGGTIGGMGTGLAVVCAYVLAGELAACDGDYAAAFARYASLIGDYARGCQKTAGGVGSFMAPKTGSGIWLRNAMLRASYRLPGKGLMEKIAMGRASAITLKDYCASV